MKEKQQIRPARKSGDSQNGRFRLLLPAGLTATYFILALAGILHHEMWRDEFQAWLVARDADSLVQLAGNVRYEGNPMLWHQLS